MNFPSERFAGATLRHVLAAMAAVHLLLLFAPWRFFAPSVGLDPSWEQVIAHAAASGWQWGSDIVFTYGPLGYLRSPIFDKALTAPVLLWNGLLVLAVIVAILGLLRHVPTGAAVALYLVIALAASRRTGQNLYLMLPVFSAFLYFRAPETSLRVPIFVLVAAGVYANAYASVLASGLVTSALMDASRLLRRGKPLFVPVFAVAVIGAFLLAGQDLGSLPRFLRSVAEVVSGYADAMGLDGNGYETLAFLGASVGALSLIIGSEWPRLADSRRRADAWLLILVIGVFWYVVWKSGFVRHDSHSGIAWRALAMGLAAYAAMRWTDIPSRSRRVSMIGLAFLSFCAAANVGSAEFSFSRVWTQVRSALVDVPLRSLEQGRDALADPGRWQADQRRRKEEAYAGMRSAFPYLAAQGTVDVIGPDQGALLAHGVDYRPQPIFQTFVAYTPWLVDLNRRHLRSTRAAGTLFVSSATIDNHYPLSDLGQSIIETFTLYRPEDVAGDYVRLRRQAVARDAAAAETTRLDAVLDEWVPVGGGRGAVMLQAELRPSVIGQLARLALRLPGAAISVRLADGSEKTHRIVPAIASDGFLLSPYADSSAIMAAQSVGLLPEAHANRVVAVKMDAESPSARRFFENRMHIRLTRLELPVVERESLAPTLVRYFDRRETVVQFARSVAGKGQNVEARGAMLFAHAPATPEITLTGKATVRARYGIAEGAWTGDGRTDGVCFRMRMVADDGRSTTLHERCLTPLERTEDRAEQEMAVQVDAAGPIRFVLETECRANCSWDWSYWKDIDVTR